MEKHKKKLFWALILLLLFVPLGYYLKSEFTARKTRVERERLLVKKQISKPLQPAEVKPLERALREEELTPSPPEIPGDEADTAEIMAPQGEKEVSEPTAEEIRAPQVPKVKRPKGEAPKKIAAKKREPVVIGEKKIVQKKRKPLVQKPPVEEKEKVKVEPEVKEKRVVSPLMAVMLEECEGVPISHRDLALLLCKELHLGSNLSYVQAVMALNGLGISPTAGWSQGDPWFPIGADELEEILSRLGTAMSIGLVAAGYPELTERLRHYCNSERAQMVETPQCEGPMVTECKQGEISQGDFAIYLCKVLGIGEDLNFEQSFLALNALHISPERGWGFEEPFALVTQREIEEVRCSVREAYEKGVIETEPTLMVASINDYCLWLKMNMEVVREGTVAETLAQTDYQGGRIPVPEGVTVASGSQ